VHSQAIGSYHCDMNRCQLATLLISVASAVSTYAANPFLDAKDDKPLSTKFQGTQWGDEIEEEEIPLSMGLVTTRVTKMPWGAIFKIEFGDLTSRARNPAGVRPKKREIRPDYFIVTDDRIVLLNEEDNDAAVKKISGLDKPPEFEPGEIYGITSGSFDHEDGLWKTTIRLKGDLCVYDANHPSGHFKHIVWKKGVGLLEYASGYGAHADGYRLRREMTTQKQ
jgi:hypothetical protein